MITARVHFYLYFWFLSHSVFKLHSYTRIDAPHAISQSLLCLVALLQQPLQKPTFALVVKRTSHVVNQKLCPLLFLTAPAGEPYRSPAWRQLPDSRSNTTLPLVWHSSHFKSYTVSDVKAPRNTFARTEETRTTTPPPQCHTHTDPAELKTQEKVIVTGWNKDHIESFSPLYK